jgi:solute carrier family 25 carnitine/acylcarnitine transporter 20/29
MSHDHKRTHWYKEGFYSLITGFLFGATNTIVGHPFDTIKTKMQAQTEHFSSHSGYVQTVKKVYGKEGFIGFYRGWMPPFLGSIVYRSI